MAAYIVKGNDGLEYGPVDAKAVASWIGERRIAPFTLLKPEGGEFREAREFPELAEALARGPMERPPVLGAGAAIDPAARLDAARAMGTAWRQFLRHLPAAYMGLGAWLFLLLALAGLLAGLEWALEPVAGKGVAKGVSVVGELLVNLFLSGPLVVGLYKFLLNVLDDAAPSAPDLMDGFRIPLPAVLSQWIKGLLFFVVMIVWLVLAAAGCWGIVQRVSTVGTMPEGADWVVLGAWAVVGATLFIVVGTLLWYVEFLIADRVRTNVIQAVEESIRMAARNIPQLAWLFTVLSLVALAWFVPAAAALWAEGFFPEMKSEPGLLPMLLFLGGFAGCFVTGPWMLLAAADSYRQLAPLRGPGVAPGPGAAAPSP